MLFFSPGNVSFDHEFAERYLWMSCRIWIYGEIRFWKILRTQFMQISKKQLNWQIWKNEKWKDWTNKRFLSIEELSRTYRTAHFLLTFNCGRANAEIGEM